MDFVKITRTTSRLGKGLESEVGKLTKITIEPLFRNIESKDLMVRSGQLYAFWDKEREVWGQKSYRLIEIIDKEISEVASEYPDDVVLEIKYLGDEKTNLWNRFVNRYLKNLDDNYHLLDRKIIFANDPKVRENYSTGGLPYALKDDDYCPAFDKLMTTFFDKRSRVLLEWAVGSIFTGDSRNIQKFVVLYGPPGTGKSTFLHIVEKLLQGYYKSFSAKEIGDYSKPFALAAFRDNPILAIQHDGDLSKIHDNTRFNSLVAHEEMYIDVKYRQPETIRVDTMLFIGSNTYVNITDSKSGLLRRILDVRSTGHKVDYDTYNRLMNDIPVELGNIARRCINTFMSLGPHAYDKYRPVFMMSISNNIFRFMLDNEDIYSVDEWFGLDEIWRRYKAWCEDSNAKYGSKSEFDNDIPQYFSEYKPRHNNKRRVYRGLRKDFLYSTTYDPYDVAFDDRGRLELDKANPANNIFDKTFSECKAQYAKTDSDIPRKAWDNVTTKLKDLDTSKVHFVIPPRNLITLDFDLKDDSGEKDLDRNLVEAYLLPSTYAETSKSGQGVHLHYFYEGDPAKLPRIYKDLGQYGIIEIKTYPGKAALRRKLDLCNDKEIATLPLGVIPEREDPVEMYDASRLKDDKHLRNLVLKNLRKEVHPATKPSIDFIYKILNDAYNDPNMSYDLSNLIPDVISFAASSTHNSGYCIDMVNKMHFRSKDMESKDTVVDTAADDDYDSEEIVFFDVEVFPNLLLIVTKHINSDKAPHQWFNPTPEEVEHICRYRLVGFNNRRYDNHILYARMMGYSNEEVYKVSKRIISHKRDAFFPQAYGLSYADIYEYSSKRQSLKKFEVELGITHKELELDWDEPVEEMLWEKVGEYCCNDVLATEAVFNARYEDFLAIEMMAEISGLRVNDSKRNHAAKIIFGDDKHPQSSFVYTDLSKMFPGYIFDNGKSSYRDVPVVGEGGYVYSEPGMYEDVITLDIASMHPSSIIALNLFGDEYTKRFKDIVDVRLAIKHGDYETAGKLFDGKLKPYLGTPDEAANLAYALKIIINSIYGYTYASFDNPFRDERNKDNIVAKRGALFMVDLRNAVQEKGYQVCHIKTDSIKIPNYDDEIVDFVVEFGKKYGYNFEIESVYDKFCLVDKANYIAKEKDGHWTATGATFKHPYVFKALFSHEEFDFNDFCEVREVHGDRSIYLDVTNKLVDPNDAEIEHARRFIGRIGSFVPMVDGNGGMLVCKTPKEEKYNFVTGTKGYLWQESHVVEGVKELQKYIDFSYFEKLADEARRTLEEFGSFEAFVKED